MEIQLDFRHEIACVLINCSVDGLLVRTPRGYVPLGRVGVLVPSSTIIAGEEEHALGQLVVRPVISKRRCQQTTGRRNAVIRSTAQLLEQQRAAPWKVDEDVYYAMRLKGCRSPRSSIGHGATVGVVVRRGGAVT